MLKTIKSGVYFLFDKGELVYIGQSNNVFYRIGQHIGENTKIFDSFEYYETNDHLSLEGFLIELFNPKYNIAGIRTTKLKPEDFFNMDILSAIKAFENMNEWIPIRYFASLLDEYVVTVYKVMSKNNIPYIIDQNGLKRIHRDNIEKIDEWEKMINEMYRKESKNMDLEEDI